MTPIDRSMTILAIRTDKPTAEIYLYSNDQRLTSKLWPAHRQLAETIHTKIRALLDKSKTSTEDLGGIVCFKGPGSFTGLRIGLSVANAIAYANNIPIVAKSGDDWLELGITSLLDGENDRIAMPEYSSTANTSTPRK